MRKAILLGFLLAWLLAGQSQTQTVFVRELDNVLAVASDGSGGACILHVVDGIPTISRRSSDSKMTEVIKESDGRLGQRKLLDALTPSHILLCDEVSVYFAGFYSARLSFGAVADLLLYRQQVLTDEVRAGSMIKYFDPVAGLKNRLIMGVADADTRFGRKSVLLQTLELVGTNPSQIISRWSMLVLEKKGSDWARLFDGAGMSGFMHSGRVTATDFWYSSSLDNRLWDIVRVDRNGQSTTVVRSVEVMDIGVATNSSGVALSYHDVNTSKYRFTFVRNGSDVEEPLYRGESIGGYPLSTSRHHYLGEDGRLTFVMDTVAGKELLVQIHNGVGTVLKTSEQEPVGRVVGMDGPSVLINNGVTSLYTARQGVAEPPKVVEAKIDSIRSAANDQTSSTFAQGDRIRLIGQNLTGQKSGSPLPTSFAFVSPWPNQLGLARVKLDGKPIPLWFTWTALSGFSIIEGQVPYNAQLGEGVLTVERLKTNFSVDTVSLSVKVTIVKSKPSIRGDQNGAYVWNVTRDYNLVTDRFGARPGDIVMLQGTGFGATTPETVAGAKLAADGIATSNETFEAWLELPNGEWWQCKGWAEAEDNESEPPSVPIRAVASPDYPGWYMLHFRIRRDLPIPSDKSQKVYWQGPVNLYLNYSGGHQRLIIHLEQ